MPAFSQASYTGDPWITAVAVNPINNSEAWATIGVASGARVFHTTNAGASPTAWSDITGAMPNVVAIASEYAPKRQMTVIVSMLFAGMPLGGLICGLVSSALIPTWGWQWVFYLGGYVPVVIALALM